MKKTDIYEIAIKILGLYLVVLILSQLQHILNSAGFLIMAENDPDTFGHFDQIPLFVGVLVPFLLLIFFSWFLIFRTKYITKLITKDIDYEENIKLFAGKKEIYEIAFVLVGFLTIVLALPDFLYKLISHIQLVQSDSPTVHFETNYLIVSGLKVVVGIIAIRYSSGLAGYFSKAK
jgi:hypothetical protein